MNVRLVVDSGGERKVVAMRHEKAVIGRSHGNTVRIPSAEVSRQHCRLVQKDGLVTVCDLGSVNGTQLNGMQIHSEEVVRPGDRVRVGPVTFIVEYELTPQALDQLRRIDENLHKRQAPLDDVVDVELEEVEFDIEEFGLDEVEEVEEVEMVEMVEAVEEVDELAPLAADFEFDASPWRLPEDDDVHASLDESGDMPPKKPKR